MARDREEVTTTSVTTPRCAASGPDISLTWTFSQGVSVWQKSGFESLTEFMCAGISCECVRAIQGKDNIPYLAHPVFKPYGKTIASSTNYEALLASVNSG